MKLWGGAAARALVSGVLIGVLIYVAIRADVWQQLKQASLPWVGGGAALLAAGWLVNSARWGLLLLAAGVAENPAILVSLYFIGMFFSQILPTGAGGDAVRMWAITRRHGKPAAAIVATFQERLVGMGMSCLLGMCVGFAYLDRLPRNWRWLPAFQAAMVIVVSIGMYPRAPLSLARRTWRALAAALSMDGLGNTTIARKLAGAFAHVENLPPLKVAQLLPILAVGLVGILFSIAEWWALGRAEGVQLSYTIYCMVVPLVWIISMLPSLGGVGVREGGFVLLMQLFGVPKQQSLAVAALFLIVQTIMSAIGGLLLLAAIWTGRWKGRTQSE